jgi:hypothetical protein
MSRPGTVLTQSRRRLSAKTSCLARSSAGATMADSLVDPSDLVPPLEPPDSGGASSSTAPAYPASTSRSSKSSRPLAGQSRVGDDFCWSCPWCPYRTSQPLGSDRTQAAKRLSERKHRHLRHVHPEHQAQEKLTTRVPSAVLSSLPSEETAYWQCPLCPAGVTAAAVQGLSESTVNVWSQEHRRDAHPSVPAPRFSSLSQSWNNRRAWTEHRRYKKAACTRSRFISRLVHAKSASPHKVEYFRWPTLRRRVHLPAAILLTSPAYRCQVCYRVSKSLAELNSKPCHAPFTARESVSRSGCVSDLRWLREELHRHPEAYECELLSSRSDFEALIDTVIELLLQVGGQKLRPHSGHHGFRLHDAE